jgi:hypothetical protein
LTKVSYHWNEICNVVEGWSIQAPRPKNPKSAKPEEAAAFKTLGDALAEEAAKHPGKLIEVFATDEHRIGLKPVTRPVWAPVRDAQPFG